MPNEQPERITADKLDERLKCKSCGGPMPEMYFFFGLYICRKCEDKK